MPRRRAENGYPRGEETRAKIIETAIELFGEKGFAGVSTREIATAASVPPPSLQYYFRNKEGLYQACLDEIQESARKAAEPALQHAEELLAAKAEPDFLIDAYCNVLESIADFLFDRPNAASRALFVAQLRLPSSSTTRPEADKSLGKRIRECCNGVLARLSPEDVSQEEIRLRSTAINGQLMVFHLVRQYLSDMIGWDEVDEKRLSMLKNTIRAQTAVLLNHYRDELLRSTGSTPR